MGAIPLYRQYSRGIINPIIEFITMESPDVPWARSHDDRIKRKKEIRPSSAGVLFLEFLRSQDRTSGRLVDLGCGTGQTAILFAESGYEVHAVDKSEEVLKDLDLHGVMPHCHSVTEYWLFEDSFFDFAMDIFCYCLQEEEEKKSFYRSELKRVLKSDGLYLLAIPIHYSISKISSEFSDFEIILKKELEDIVDGKPLQVLAIIMKQK